MSWVTDQVRAPAAKRERIVDTAERLVREHGYAGTSLADISRESGVPLGNLYYYFKTKDAIGSALVEKMLRLRANDRLRWDAELAPRERILAYLQWSLASRASIARSGCPIGSLCSELQKEPGPLAEQATGIFTVYLQWLEAQFRLLGKGAESRELAFHLVSAVQGASLLANAFHDPRRLKRECDRLKSWVEAL
jgi:TetR/AcrR family transcriptional repressor of nem operon